ncbi:MAG: hypothetical protein WBQ41_03555 [Solirubrobacterales bacterium]
MPPGSIERGDEVIIPASQVPAEFAEGEHSFTIFDEWNGELGAFVGVNVTAVQDAVNAATEGEEEIEQSLVVEALNDEANWVDSDDPPEGAELLICSLDASTGRLLTHPHPAYVMGYRDFDLLDGEKFGREGLWVGLDFNGINADVDAQVASLGREVTEEERAAIFNETQNDPYYWLSASDMPDDAPEGSQVMAAEFNPQTGRVG